ncbi:IS701 family transposase [Streptomyces actuosus]|uniref:IS701 family transposase n=1 Tax=Streptomyces actuosus TaxID=1885 RepID=A0ABS2VQI0_STRAS|nr:IS701 family transposase [Streptomyces actuosus]MBN0045346.1 IS701 family transposase [Streptomyces actuosus]
MGRIAGRFARVEPRLRAGRLVLGLLSDLPRKNCWTIAEWAGEASPHGMQHLLCRAVWDADAVRDDVREYVVEHLYDEAAVLVVDETGDVKKGSHTVGVQRQYTGTAGRIENSQVAVYLVYAGERGHAAVDRELYIPRSWTCDPDRCQAAGLGQDTVFATKPDLARTMIERFLDAGHHVGWVTGDEVYGGNPKLRTALEERGIGYVLAVACSAEVPTGAGRFRADDLARKVPKRAWQKLSAGPGAKGQRFYDWAVIDLAETAPGRHQLLIRRNHSTGELAYYRCHSTTPASLATLVKVAGSRWRVEETFQTEKGLAGLDEHQVRRYPSWARWVSLAMLAHAFLAVVRADEHAHRPTPDDLIPLTCNEICRLFIALIIRPARDAAHRLAWSDWRRRHQARSRTSHYRRQTASQT